MEEYFAAHRADFDTVSFAQFAVPDAEQAQRIVDEIRARGPSTSTRRPSGAS